MPEPTAIFPVRAPRRARRGWVLALMLSIGLPAWAAPALDLPELGEVARASLSESHEARIGREIMRQIRAQGAYLDDPVVQEYLARVGERLASVSPDPARRFEFFALRDASINAFALPGGYIGMHTGLISATRNESELAAVLAHEVAHVTQQHIARMVDAQRTHQLVSAFAVALAILAARSNSELAQAAMTTSHAYGIQSQLNFTRENERDADRVGLQILTAAGYAPQGMVSFFQRLQARGRLNEHDAPAYLRTHPLTFERIADMEHRLAQMPYVQHQDSLEYLFVRARIQAEEGEAAEAQRRFEARVQDHADAGDWYGLARASLRAGQLARARQALARLQPETADSPLVALLAGEVELAARRYRQAATALAAGMAQHPGYRPLVYLHAEALLHDGRAEEALHALRAPLRLWRGDARLRVLEARAQHALGRVAEAHLAQAEAHALLDQIGAAIDQLQRAQTARAADFHTQSIIDARLRELKRVQGEAGERSGGRR